jgi:predicted AAA+ superfamily ATPase
LSTAPTGAGAWVLRTRIYGRFPAFLRKNRHFRLKFNNCDVIYNLILTKLVAIFNLMDLKSRHFRGYHHHYFLFGPRGTGKSTWLRAHHADATWVDLLVPSQFRAYEARPERLEEILPPEGGSGVVVIDEIQRVPQILPVVHSAMERRRDLQFILTGSSSRKLRAAGVDLLGGRAALKTLHPFMASELGDDFELSEALRLGMIPVNLSAPERADALSGYIDVYLRQEVQAEAMVRRIDSFTRFLEAISFSQASLLNLSDVARDCEVKRSTVAGFAEIIEDLLIASYLPVFSRRAKRHLVSHRKFFFFDCGVFRSLRPAGPLDAPAEIDGVALETLVYQHLRAWIAYGNRNAALYFWRTQSGSEVDFVIYGEGQFWAVEVKNTRRVRPKDLRSLRTFSQDYPGATPIFLYRGDELLRMGDILCIPVNDFLKQLVPDMPMWSL